MIDIGSATFLGTWSFFASPVAPPNVMSIPFIPEQKLPLVSLASTFSVKVETSQTVEFKRAGYFSQEVMISSGSIRIGSQPVFLGRQTLCIFPEVNAPKELLFAPYKWLPDCTISIWSLTNV